MAYDGVSALTPSRAAPPPPRRGPSDLLSSGASVYSNAPSFQSYNTATSTPGSFHSSYSGIGGSPDRGSPAGSSSNGIRSGYVSLKEDGFASLFWSKKWLVLRDEALSIHRNEVRHLALTRNRVCSELTCPTRVHRRRSRTRRKLVLYGSEILLLSTGQS